MLAVQNIVVHDTITRSIKKKDDKQHNKEFTDLMLN